MTSFRWVESAGGPLLVAPRSELTHWGGSTDDDGPVETWGDYERACAVEGYIGFVPIGAQQALVLGDEPAPTTYLPAERLFLRWAAAYSEGELLAAAERVVHGQIQWDEDEDLVWDVREPAVLFDAALSGSEMEPDNHLVVELEPGRYRIRATSLTDHDNWMILVQLQPTTQVTEWAVAMNAATGTWLRCSRPRRLSRFATLPAMPAASPGKALRRKTWSASDSWRICVTTCRGASQPRRRRPARRGAPPSNREQALTERPMSWTWNSAGPEGRAWMLGQIEGAGRAWTPPPIPAYLKGPRPMTFRQRAEVVLARWPVDTPAGREPLPAEAHVLKVLDTDTVCALYEEAGRLRLGLGTGGPWLRAHLARESVHYLFPDPASYYWPGNPNGRGGTIRWWQCTALLRMYDDEHVSNMIGQRRLPFLRRPL